MASGDIVLAVSIIAAGWLMLGLFCILGYGPDGGLPALTLHNFFALPFVAVGDLLNTIARRHTGALLRRVHNACVAGYDHERASGGFKYVCICDPRARPRRPFLR